MVCLSEMPQAFEKNSLNCQQLLRVMLYKSGFDTLLRSPPLPALWTSSSCHLGLAPNASNALAWEKALSYSVFFSQH